MEEELKKWFDDYVIGDAFKELAFCGETKNPFSAMTSIIWFILNSGHSKKFELTHLQAEEFHEYWNANFHKRQERVDNVK